MNLKAKAKAIIEANKRFNKDMNPKRWTDIYLQHYHKLNKTPYV